MSRCSVRTDCRGVNSSWQLAPLGLLVATYHRRSSHPSVDSGNRDPGADEVEDPAGLLFEAFLISRTTLDDLSRRTAVLGADVSPPAIAALLTGRRRMSVATRNVVAAAINVRLAELAMPASAPVEVTVLDENEPGLGGI